MVELGVGVPVALRLRVALGVLPLVPVVVGVAAPVWLLVLVGVDMREPVPLGVPLTVLVWVALCVMLPDRLRRLARLRPRYVSRVMTSSGVSSMPPPGPPLLADSHRSTDSRTPLAIMLTGTNWVMLTYRKQSAAPKRPPLASNA